MRIILVRNNKKSKNLIFDCFRYNIFYGPRFSQEKQKLHYAATVSKQDLFLFLSFFSWTRHCIGSHRSRFIRVLKGPLTNSPPDRSTAVGQELVRQHESSNISEGGSSRNDSLMWSKWPFHYVNGKTLSERRSSRKRFRTIRLAKFSYEWRAGQIGAMNTKKGKKLYKTGRRSVSLNWKRNLKWENHFLCCRCGKKSSAQNTGRLSSLFSQIDLYFVERELAKLIKTFSATIASELIFDVKR